MPAKRKPARRAATSRASSTAARRRTTTTPKTARKKTVSRARNTGSGRVGARLAKFTAKRLENHSKIVNSRKDAAILRATHEGCAQCGGNGQIFTKGKGGVFNGSKPCPATPTKTKVSKLAVWKASRFSTDRSSGLVGCSCPCGWKQKARYRDAKLASQAIQTHNKAKHGGGKGVGATWYAQVVAPAAVEQQPAVSKVVTDSGMTDQQWIKQNKKLHPGKAIAQGKCWKCAGNGSLYGAFGNEQIVVVCNECRGAGKPATQAA